MGQDWLDDLLDLNGDGKITPDEEFLSFKLFQQTMEKDDDEPWYDSSENDSERYEHDPSPRYTEQGRDRLGSEKASERASDGSLLGYFVIFLFFVLGCGAIVVAIVGRIPGDPVQGFVCMLLALLGIGFELVPGFALYLYFAKMHSEALARLSAMSEDERAVAEQKKRRRTRVGILVCLLLAVAGICIALWCQIIKR